MNFGYKVCEKYCAGFPAPDPSAFPFADLVCRCVSLPVFQFISESDEIPFSHTDCSAAAPKAHTHQVKKLKGRDGYRLRVGKWRIIFAVNGNVLEVLEVGARGSVYD